MKHFETKMSNRTCSGLDGPLRLPSEDFTSTRVRLLTVRLFRFFSSKKISRIVNVMMTDIGRGGTC